jgi:hypothetical protein
VVSVIVDQLGSATLLRHFDALDPKGAIRQAAERGAFFERSVYPQANTLTAPGHALTYTGTTASENGVDTNAIWDRQAGRIVQAVADVRYPVFGREASGVTAGPGRLVAPTVAEALKLHTAGAARVVSLSLKDRGAIYPAGRTADLVMWFDTDLGRFTSSGVWRSRLPEWVERYRVSHPLEALLTPWSPLSPDQYLHRLGPDDAPGEGPLPGGDSRFPHLFTRGASPWVALRSSPRLSEYLIELAGAAVLHEGLGQDDVPDLLLLSISGTDYVGHSFGPDSWEYLDHLTRADRALGLWLERLGQSLPISVLITSDHGVAPLPESRRGQPGGRVYGSRVQHAIEARLKADFGAGSWVATVLPPYVYLSDAARRHPEFARLSRSAVEALVAMDGILGVWPIETVRKWSTSKEPLQHSLAASLPASCDADLMFITRPYHAVDIGRADGLGTHHGSPHPYDTDVPVLCWGPGVPHLRRSAAISQLSVAPTLARLLGAPPPAMARAAPLF